MDDDDCDIFADVTKFCNSNSLEDQISKAQVTQVDGVDIGDIPLHEFESTGTKRKTTEEKQPSSVKNTQPSPVKNTQPKSRGRKSKAKNPESASISEPSAQGNVAGNTIDELLGSSDGTRPRRGRSARGGRQQTLDNLNRSIANLIASLNSRNPVPPIPQPQANTSQRGRARRNFMAELAARSNVVGVVDLVSSPPLPLPNLTSVVSLDSDDEVNEVTEVKNFDVSFDSENPEISVKVKWGDGIETFTHRKYQKFSDLMNIFAKREDVAISDILLNLNDHIIQPNDTPDSIDYKIYQFISGRIIRDSLCRTQARPKKKNVNEIELKIQSDAWKKPISVSIKKDDTFRILYIKCSEELKVPVDSIKLSFDGEPIDLDGTPNDLELEGEEIIDCRLKR